MDENETPHEDPTVTDQVIKMIERCFENGSCTRQETRVRLYGHNIY